MNINEIKEALKNATQGEWTNFDDGRCEHSKLVAEYDRLTESMGGLIATCENLNDARLIAYAPEWLASLVTKVEEMQKTLEWYADEKNYDVFEINTEEQGIIVMTEYWTNVTKDEGERARKALKGDNQ